MKLKSKLIATIVSMCAAIAVMGVGVWASSSQSFQITVKNDIDVKIISVDADVYGEFAVYSQFSGHTEKGKTNAYAQAYHASRGQAAAKFIDRNNMDHGYLLYSSTLGGYNDGKNNSDATYTEDATKWYNTNVVAEPTSGYYKYTNEAKEGVYFATAESDGISDSTWKDEESWASDSYNIDFTTRTAQITYMYTIRQWKKASANAATNEIELLLQSSISYDSAIEEDIDNELNEDAGTTADNLTDALYNAAGTAGIYIDAYITNASETTELGAGSANAPAQGAPNGTGATAETLTWRKMDLTEAYSLPASECNETYYIVLTYTFARTGANLDLSGLQNAVEHTLVLTPPEKLVQSDFYTGTQENIVSYDEIPEGRNTMLCYATGVYDSNSAVQYSDEGGYQIYGKEFVPKFSPAQISKNLTQKELASYFALYDTSDVTTFNKNYVDGVGYTELENYLFQKGADQVAKDMPNHSNILMATAGDGKFGTNPTSIDRAGYIFATPIGEDEEDKNIVKDPGGQDAYFPELTPGSTGWCVKQFNDGNPVEIVSHPDSIGGAIDTNPNN